MIMALSFLHYPRAKDMMVRYFYSRRNSETIYFFMWILNALYFVKIQITFFSLSKWSNLISIIHSPTLPNIAKGKVLLREPAPPPNIYTLNTK